MEIVIQSVGPTNFSKESPKFIFYEIWLYKYKNNYKIKLKKKRTLGIMIFKVTITSDFVSLCMIPLRGENPI